MEDVFVTDNLPQYAKSYILPKIMKKDVVDARIGLVKKGSSKSTSDDKSLEAFKFSMLKATLDFENEIQLEENVFGS